MFPQSTVHRSCPLKCLRFLQFPDISLVCAILQNTKRKFSNEFCFVLLLFTSHIIIIFPFSLFLSSCPPDCRHQTAHFLLHSALPHPLPTNFPFFSLLFPLHFWIHLLSTRPLSQYNIVQDHHFLRSSASC